VKSKKLVKALIPTAVVAALILAAVIWVLNARGETDIAIANNVGQLVVRSSAFEDLGVIPEAYTGNGADISPGFQLGNLSEDAVSIAIIMDDLDVPWSSNFTHWVIWDIPARSEIPEAISPGGSVGSPDGATQGVAFGVNRYSGPKPPFGTHRYQFHVFALDGMMELEPSAGKQELLSAMDGHMLQYGTLMGWYPSKA
jgi:Raf kinase inhibitor-like YbhB/YbcL family protein